MGKKDRIVWFQCPSCKAEYRTKVVCDIHNGKLFPYCIKCNSNLVRKTS